jgi:outer membrane protein assembly factor BamB
LLTFGGSADRTNRVAAGPNPARVHQSWLSPALDGDVYGEPLVLGDRVYVATEGNGVYALDATNGQVAWHTALGDPVPGDSLPCGNIDPSGITGTPVIDPASSTLYAVAFVQPGRHDLVAIDLAGGAVKFRRAVDPPGLSPLVEQERGALTIANGRVYVPFGGLYGDCGPYKGAVVSAAADGSGDLASWEVPTEREGGIWAPSGAAVDPSGNLFVATGNAASTDPNRFDDGNAVVRLTPGLQQADDWAPTDWADLSASDSDLGSIGPVLTGDRVVVAGKSGEAYVLAANALGGIGGERNHVDLCRGGGFGGAAASTDGMVVVGCSGGPSGARLSPDGSLTAAWHGPSGRSGAPVIAAGTVWVEQNNGHVLALSLADGSVAGDVDLGTSVPGFPTPAVTETAVYAPAGSHVVALGAG